MAKKQVFRRNSEKYKELCHMFCTKFTETFGEISGMTYQDVEKLFRKRVKKIRIAGNVNCYGDKRIDIASEYHELGPGFEHVFIHEALHAISAQHKRRTILLSVKSLLFKKTSDFPIDEGITEYYTSCMEKQEKFTLAPNMIAYRYETITMELLEKVIDKKSMMKFYLKNDKNFIKSINRTIPKGYSEIKKILSNADGGWALTGFNKENMKKLSPIRNLIQKNMLNPANTIEAFKENLNLLLEIYSPDMYSLAHKMYYDNNLLKKAKNDDERRNISKTLNTEKQQFNELKKILYEHWKKIGINDDNKFNEIVMNFIKEKHPYIYHPISFANIFLVTEEKTIENSQEKTKSYSFDRDKPRDTNQYYPEETVSQGRGR